MNAKSFFKKSILTSAFLLMFCMGAFAQWYGTVILNNGEVVSSSVLLFGDVTINVPSGTATITGDVTDNGSWRSVTKTGSGKLIFTNNNNYWGGYTTVNGGILQIGNGSSGKIGGNEKVTVNGGAVLRFEPGEGYTFSKLIDGEGSVEFKGGGYLSFFTADNAYNGTTTVEAGNFVIGGGGTTGNIAGNIINNSEVHFHKGTDYAYSGVISGTGNLSVSMGVSATLTLNGANTYSGGTSINACTLVLGTNGSIENSNVELVNGTPKLDISSSGYGKKIKGLYSNTNAAQVVLGYRTLTIGTAGQDDGSGNFAGVISGNGDVVKNGSGTLIITGENTFSGSTRIYEGTLQIGGASGKVSSSIDNNSILVFNHTNDYTITGDISGPGAVWFWGGNRYIFNGYGNYYGSTAIDQGSTVVFEEGSLNNSIWIALGPNSKIEIPSGNKKIRAIGSEHSSAEIILGGNCNLTIGNAGYADGNGDFHGVISGSGNIIKYGSSELTLRGNNTYTGTTTIYESRINIFGSHTGDFINNGNDFLVFWNTSSPLTYSGTISGTGNLGKFGAQTLTLNGVNTFTGVCHFYDGTVALSSSGSMENSGHIILVNGDAKFDVSAGNKKIKAISGHPNSGIILGSTTLTIGTAGENDGVGNFEGIFYGYGGVTKAGSGDFTISNVSTANGLFSLQEGTLYFGKQWGGNFSQSAGSNLIIKNEVIIGGFLTLSGGNISMDLTTTVPSKINVYGAVSASGTNKLKITSYPVTNQVIMQAASGLNNASNFELNMPGFETSLNATGTQLLLTAIIFPEGDGSENFPYIITTAAQLAQLAFFVNSGNENYNNKHYKLGNDINLSDYGVEFNDGTGWIPIGQWKSSEDNQTFKGVFDGNGKKIIGLFINNTVKNDVGLFGNNCGTIKNLGVTGATIISSINFSTACAGILVGSNHDGTILDCYTTGSVVFNSTGEHPFAGGIAGNNNKIISNCNSTATVICSGLSNVCAGGIVGINGNEANVSNCNSTGPVTSSTINSSEANYSYAGGVVGYNGDGDISNSYSSSSVSCSGAVHSAHSGGVTGYNRGNISKCYSTGYISCDALVFTRSGGVAGVNYGNITNCYSAGMVTSTAGENEAASGGLVGYNVIGNISNCYSTSKVSATTGYNVSYTGGIVGFFQEGSVSNCYSTWVITGFGSGSNYVGGLIGAAADWIENNTISNCAALNIALDSDGSDSYGRIVANTPTMINNIAFDNMLNPDGEPVWENKGANKKDGEDITNVAIFTDGTLGGRFTSENGWTTQNGKLPGLLGNIVDLPDHLSPVPKITTKILPNGETDVSYIQTLTADGVTPITWSLESSVLPDGLALSNSGIIAGVPTLRGRFTFSVKATNIYGSDVKELSLYIHTPGFPMILTTNLPDGVIGELYDKQLEVESNTPVTWSIIDGKQPDGIGFSSTSGAFIGVPSAIGTFTFTVRAVNDIGDDVIQLSIEIKAVGVEELQVTSYEIQVYPNPTSGEVIIATSDMRYAICDIEIFDVMGRMVFIVGTGHAPSLQSTTIDISHLPSGVYFLRIHTENGVVTKKIIKQ
jgi:autotransporter-associated beta strand protein